MGIKRAEPGREAKRANRERQGWQQRRPLTIRQLVHDGSTDAERRKRKPPATTPWVPA